MRRFVDDNPRIRMAGAKNFPSFARIARDDPRTWNHAYHVELITRWREKRDQRAANILLEIAVRGGQPYRRYRYDQEDKWAWIGVRLAELLERWDPEKAGWVTFVRSQCRWWHSTLTRTFVRAHKRALRIKSALSAENASAGDDIDIDFANSLSADRIDARRSLGQIGASMVIE